MKILLVAYDNGSYTPFFPQGLAYLAAALKGWHDVEIYSQDIHHFNDEHLTAFLDNNNFDAVGIGVIAGYYQFAKLKSLCKAVRKAKCKHQLLIGGHGPTPAPEFFAKQTDADFVLMGEAEETIVELLDALSVEYAEEKDKTKKLSEIQSLAYYDNDNFVINKRRQVEKNLENIPFPAYDIFPIESYRLYRKPHASNTDFVFPILTGRGCSFKCNFCYRLEPGYRTRNSESILEEIAFLQEQYGITYFIFSDELFMGSIAKTLSRCNDFLQSNIKFKWSCDGRLNYAIPKVLSVMKQSGCQFINYGIESVDNDVLKNMNKKLTVKQVIKGVENTINAGISPGLNIIWGNIGDTKQSLQNGVNFLLKYSDGAQLRTIRPVTPYPGSPLFDYAIDNGYINDVDDFYTRHVNSDLLTVNFTKLSDDEFYSALSDANQTLIAKYYQDKMRNSLAIVKNLYGNKDASFRGFRPV